MSSDKHYHVLPNNAPYRVLVCHLDDCDDVPGDKLTEEQYQAFQEYL